MLAYPWPTNWQDRKHEEKEDEQNRRITKVLAGRRCPGKDEVLKKLRGEEMKGKWDVTSNLICGEIMYGVVRVIDVDAVDHSGNREYHGAYLGSRAEAEAIADRLNLEDAGSY